MCRFTRQNRATEKVWAHGLVLCLACLFDGRYASPCCCRRKGNKRAGRPMKISYRLPGGMPGNWAKKKPPRRTGAALCSIEASQGIGQARSADNLSVSKNYIRLFPVSPKFSLSTTCAPILMAALTSACIKNQSAPLKHAALFQFFIAQFNKRFLHIHKRDK